MTVVHADRVDLLLIALNAIRRADVVTENPGLRWSLSTSKAVDGTTGEHAVAERR